MSYAEVESSSLAWSIFLAIREPLRFGIGSGKSEIVFWKTTSRLCNNSDGNYLSDILTAVFTNMRLRDILYINRISSRLKCLVEFDKF